MAKVLSKFKTFTLQLSVQATSEFEPDNISIVVTTAKSTAPKEFNPHTFNNATIPFEVYIENSEKEETKKANLIDVLGEKIAIPKEKDAEISIKVQDNLIQTVKLPYTELLAHLNKNEPYKITLAPYQTELTEVKSSVLSFRFSDENPKTKLILAFHIEYGYAYNDTLIVEQKEFVINEERKLKIELPEKSSLGQEFKVKVLDIQNNEVSILSINNQKPYQSIINANVLRYDAVNEVKIASPDIRILTQDPLTVFPSRIRGKVIDISAKVKLSNCQLILFREKYNTPILYTKTNINGDFSETYPKINFGQDERVYAVLATDVQQKVYLQLEEKTDANGSYYRLSEYNLLVLNNLDASVKDDCGCKEHHAGDTPCSCRKGENINRLPEYEDLINDDQYTQDIGGSCVNFTKPNRTLSESTFYAIVRTTEPKIIGLDLMEIDQYIKDIESKEKVSLPLKKSPIGLYSTARYPWNKTSYKVKDRFELSGNNLVDWDETPLCFQAVTLAFGHLIQYRQRFYSNGYSLGNIITTEGLAPGQVKKIAILDWKRSQTSNRSEQLDYRDELEASTDHTQDFEELQSAMLNENSAGGSSSKVSSTTAAIGAGIGGVFPGGIFGVAGGVGTTSSNASSEAWQNNSKNTSASMNSHLADRTKQSAKNIRSQRATVITSDTQMESVGARTEVLANYNHCHSINNVFFEVLRHVAVRQDVTSVSECLFVPLLISEFTKEKVYRWKEHLKSVMLSNIHLRKRIGHGFDALERIMSPNGYDNFPSGSYADETVQEIYGEFEIELNISMPADDYNPDASGNKYTLNQAKWETLLKLCPALGGFNAIAAKLAGVALATKVATFNKEYAPKLAANLLKKLEIKANGNTLLPLDLSLSTSYSPDKKVKVFVRSKGLPFSISRKSITNVTFDIGDLTSIFGTSIKLNDIGSKAVIKSARLHYRTDYSSGLLCNSATVENDLGYGDPVVIYTPCNVHELKNQKKEDETALANLLSICNENMERLHASIWMKMSEQKIFFLLDGIKIPTEINGKPLPSNIAGKSVASIVNSKPIGVVGNSLVLKITDGVNADPIYRLWNKNADNAQEEFDKITNAGQIPVEDLLEVYQPLTPVEPYQISFPTGGYFMETVMGACNSCEKIDDSKFWKWEEHPIPITPSDIQAVNLDSRYQQPLDTKPTEFPQSNISIQNIPQGPQPTGLGASLDLLSKSGIFKDITGLEGTQNLAAKGMDISKGAMESAMSNAVAAMNSAAAYDLAKDKQKSENFDKLMNANLPPELKEKIANDFAAANASNDASNDMKNKTNKVLDQAETAIRENAKGADTFNKVVEGLEGKFDEISVKPNGEITAKGATLTNDLKQWVTNNSEALLEMAKMYDLKQDGKTNEDNGCWAYALATTLLPAYDKSYWETLTDAENPNQNIIEKVLGLLTTEEESDDDDTDQ